MESGRWTDPYSGEAFTDAAKLDIDHMVPLRNAQCSGGWEWTKQRRQEYVDNPEHLIAVKASVNRSKSDQGPDKWTPPNASYHCQYARDWEGIKERWGLEMSTAEAEAVEAMKGTCP